MTRIPVHLFLTGDFRASAKRIHTNLVQIDEGMEPVLMKKLLEAAYFMKTMAQGYCPVDTGSLQTSIRVERIRKLSVRVRAGGYVTNPKTGRKVDYAKYVEEKHPFMKPAWEHTRKFVEVEVTRALEELVVV